MHISNADKRKGNIWHLNLLPYKCAQCTVAVAVIATGADDVGIASPPASAKEPTNTVICENCGEPIPEARYNLHYAYCARHNCKCHTCGHVLRKVSNAWSCDDCLYY